ncbi:hypothetical protein MC378_06780 [Polaribacter sp. MSW13]|uniref:Uncharacterized protein n=1 Tax=Polaribacter marinus TaxID=2916838 RepID=A0A9X2AJB4_9FLAO|nr:hypothetical protein [Polaribacter marinus]MCI2228867.1 hypothetical protein [Polaribacter marinus]
MKKLFSISLSLIILLQSVGFNIDDIAQINKFIEHAEYHNKQYGDNVFVFISKHYGELKSPHEKEHQEEKEDHEQLPFNHNNCSHNGSIATYIVSSFKEELKTPFLLEQKKVANFYYQDPFSTSHSDEIIQPPRFS